MNENSISYDNICEIKNELEKIFGVEFEVEDKIQNEINDIFEQYNNYDIDDEYIIEYLNKIKNQLKKELKNGNNNNYKSVIEKQIEFINYKLGEYNN